MKKINCLIIGLVFAFFVLINIANGRVVEVDFQKNDLNDLIVEEMPLEYPFDQERPKIEGCQIDVNKHLNEPQPLILQPGTESFLFPNSSDGIINLSKGAVVELFCTNSFYNWTDTQYLYLTCVNNTQFSVDNKLYDFNYFNCTKYPFHTAKRTGKTCFNNASVLDVGFEVGKRFLKVFEICFDEALERTHFVTHEFTPAYYEYQHNFPRPSWYVTGYFQGKNVDNLYTRYVQRETLKKILNSTSLAEKYIPETTDFYLARGHISAKSDYILGNHHRTTFWLMNVAPQWQVFNGGNWQHIENGIKEFVFNRNIEVDAYTGTYGTTTLNDTYNKPQEFYLAFDKNNNGLIPVPKIYYKILVDRKTKDGIVLIGVNNPYLTMKEIEQDYIFCKDVGDSINWIKWVKTDLTLGYSYACDVNEFMNVIKHIPDLKVNGLLL